MAGAILEKIFAEQPEHPGLAHHRMHCYDYHPLANSALDAARRYAKIAPDSPHALHMPSHIFTRLGYWQESIESNLASAAAAQKEGAQGDQLHAMDYLVYAYLQGAQDVEAKKAFEALPQLRQSRPRYFARRYPLASMPARYAVERHRWAEAAVLTVPPDLFPGGRYAWTEANIHLALALGASRTGDTEAARKSLQQLTSLPDRLVHDNQNDSPQRVGLQ